MTHPWEDVGGTLCPECGEPTGTVMRSARVERPSGPLGLLIMMRSTWSMLFARRSRGPHGQ